MPIKRIAHRIKNESVGQFQAHINYKNSKVISVEPKSLETKHRGAKN